MELSLRELVRFLNQPVVKEGIKKVTGTITFAFGILEIKEIFEGRFLPPKETPTVEKVAIVMAKLSLLLSAATTPPAVFIISRVVGSLIPNEVLERMFGKNTTFAVNPWHPRHVTSLAAVALAVPSLAILIWKGTKEIKETKLKISFNTITSRPVLHWGNSIGRWLIK